MNKYLLSILVLLLLCACGGNDVNEKAAQMLSDARTALLLIAYNMCRVRNGNACISSSSSSNVNSWKTKRKTQNEASDRRGTRTSV